ncbi:MAG TPA: HD family phosphohydrolase, partial [Geobacteraceae bacterium]
MSEELCEMSLQQTQELLRLIDTVLQNICCRRFSGEDLYVEALQRVLGGAGRRGPAKIFMVFQEQDGTIRSGRVFHLRQGSVEGSEEVTIDPASSYALSLSLTEVQNDVIVANWANGSESVKAYQQVFPPEVMALVEGGVRNFVCYHISGETPGVVAAFNYPGRATDYDATVLRSLAVVIGSLVTLSDEVRETEMAFI